MARRRWRGSAVVAAGVVVAVALIVAGGTRAASGGSAQSIEPSPPATTQLQARAAAALLATVPTKGRAPKTGYSRSQFGSGWASVHGCDMRNRILARDLSEVQYRPGRHRCVVVSGVLDDPYTGKRISFVRGNTTSRAVQVDHRYPLVLAWQQGAQQWPQQRREAFANDADNLVAVDGSANAAKGGSGPGSWLPPNKAYRCTYVIRFVEVTAKWDLSVNPGDRAQTERILNRCAGDD